MSNRTRYGQQFYDISMANTSMVDDLLQQAGKLNAKKQYKVAHRLLDIAQRILENNKRLQNTVGKILSDG
jgi:hypothetical protein